MPPKNKGGDVEATPRFGRPGNNLKMGIVGLPNVGKSSLFNLLGESAEAAAENYPFCTIEPNTARCAVPDKRYKQLCDIWVPPSKYPAFLHLVDIAGLIKGVSELALCNDRRSRFLNCSQTFSPNPLLFYSTFSKHSEIKG
jgi:obg-like ATPase 1